MPARHGKTSSCAKAEDGRQGSMHTPAPWALVKHFSWRNDPSCHASRMSPGESPNDILLKLMKILEIVGMVRNMKDPDTLNFSQEDVSLVPN